MTQTFNHTQTIETSGVSGTGSSDPSFKWVTEPVPVTPMHNKALDFDNYLQSKTVMIDAVIAKSVQVANEADANNNVPQLYRNFTKCKDMEQRINDMG